MKSQVILLEQLLHDAGDALGFSAERDVVTLRWRFEKEGMPFLSIALPRLDDALLEGLRSGSFPSLEGWATEGKLPLFLHGAWKQIFTWDGLVLPDPSIDAIRWIRQITRICKKIFEVCDDHRVQAAIDQFVTTDRNLPSRAETKAALPHQARRVAHLLFGQLIGEAMLDVSSHGKHGPGAVSESFGVNERWDFTSISYNVEELMGPEYFRSSWIDLLERPPLNGVVPARLVAVPKTATTPRLISIEPSYNQFVQQALQTNLKRLLERDRFACSYTDQSYNQRMALEGSVHGRNATIDLSEASDRVSLALVEELFGFNPGFVRYLRLSRSAFVQLPDGELVLLNKFASMGSALTFPIESMVFHTLAVLAMMEHSGNSDDWFIRSYQRRCPELSVYGDDIIIDRDVAPKLIKLLTSLGMRVNETKSFLSGSFRESCGVDAFLGRDVTPAYQRAALPQSTTKSSEIVKASSLRNQLFERFGEIRSVRFLDSLIGRLVKYPAVPRGMTGIGRWSDVPDHSFSRWNDKLQRLEWRMPTLVETKRRDTIDGYSALQKALRTELNEDPDHLVFAGRPVATEIHYRWCAEV